MPTSPPPLSVTEAAARVGIPARTLRYAILRGGLKAHKMSGATGAYMINQRDLERWNAKRVKESASA